eukprot:3939773-Rhodomonas_salina.1
MGLGITLVDSLDTMLLLDLHDTPAYARAREWVATHFDTNIDRDLSVFETSIRVLGGLLSTYALSGDTVYLNQSRSALALRVSLFSLSPLLSPFLLSSSSLPLSLPLRFLLFSSFPSLFLSSSLPSPAPLSAPRSRSSRTISSTLPPLTLSPFSTSPFSPLTLRSLTCALPGAARWATSWSRPWKPRPGSRPLSSTLATAVPNGTTSTRTTATSVFPRSHLPAPISTLVHSRAVRARDSICGGLLHWLWR